MIDDLLGWTGALKAARERILNGGFAADRPRPPQSQLG
jgi:hypothetical protein